jgi:dTDP-4-amino-4,6-dideoxygalactose transaminase
MPYRNHHLNARIAQSLLTSHTHREHAMLMGRAAAGIYAALRVLVPEGARVGIPANTCYIVLWAVLRVGCQPVLLDIDPATGNLPSQPDTRGHALHAIIPCHMYGLPAPMRDLCAWADECGIVVIEDAALALGATVDSRPAGAWGMASVVSFGAGKIVDHGVGGAVLVDDTRLAVEIGRVRAQMPAWDDRLIDLTTQWHALYWALHQYEDRNPGLAALYPQLFALYGELVAYHIPSTHWRGLAQSLHRLHDDRARRLALAAQCDAQLGIDGVERMDAIADRTRRASSLQTLIRQDGATLWKYPLLVPAGLRDDLLAHLWDAGMHEATRWYPSLRTMAEALTSPSPHAERGSGGEVPQANALAARIINLPLTDEATVQRYAEAIGKYMSDGDVDPGAL